MFYPTDLPEVIEVRPNRYADERGHLFESWSRERYRQGGIDLDFVQDNVSFSLRPGTIRGLHLQLDPAAQAKLISCLSGAILDVAVDIRPHSATFGRHVAIEISAAKGNQLYIPAGFAHGFCTLEKETLITYRASALYTPALERSVAFDDPALAIDWPVDRRSAMMSDRDASAPSLAALAKELRGLAAQ